MRSAGTTPLKLLAVERDEHNLLAATAARRRLTAHGRPVEETVLVAEAPGHVGRRVVGAAGEAARDCGPGDGDEAGCLRLDPEAHECAAADRAEDRLDQGGRRRRGVHEGVADTLRTSSRPLRDSQTPTSPAARVADGGVTQRTVPSESKVAATSLPPKRTEYAVPPAKPPPRSSTAVPPATGPSAGASTAISRPPAPSSA